MLACFQGHDLPSPAQPSASVQLYANPAHVRRSVLAFHSIDHALPTHCVIRAWATVLKKAEHRMQIHFPRHHTVASPASCGSQRKRWVHRGRRTCSRYMFAASEGRGKKLYLISMIEDATSELTAGFVRHDASEENLQQLRGYVERHGRPAAVHTDKACLFQVTPRAMALPLYFQSLGS
jgi:hypothetical protein